MSLTLRFIRQVLVAVLLLSAANSHAQLITKIDSLEALVRQTRHDTTRVRLMNDLAYAYYASNPEKTIELTEKSIQLAKRLNSKKDYLYGLYVNGIGKSIISGNDEAAKTATLLIRESQRLKSDFNKAQGHFLYAFLLRNQSRDKEALENFKESLALFKATESAPNVANVYSQLAFTYSKLSNYSIAIKYYLLAAKMLKAENQIEGYKSTLNNLGETYLQIKNYRLALKYFSESMAIGEKLKNQIWIGSDYLSIAKLYIQTNRIPEAKSYLSKALNVFTSIPFDRGTASVLNTLGTVSLNENRTAAALDYFKKALAINLKEGNNYYLIENYHNIGCCYQKMKQYDAALSYFKKALGIATQHNYAELKRDSFQLLAELYTEIGDYKTGNDFLKRYETVKDSLFDEVKNNQILTLQVEYDTEQKEIDNKLLKQKNDIQKLTIEKQQQSTRIISAVLVSFVILAFVLYRLFRAKKIANARLQSAKNTIDTKNIILEATQQKLQTSLHEKEILLKEIHHRVKNNLQLINSLLSIQARSTDRTLEVAEFLNKSQNRVESMALIHETLYLSDNLSKVDFEKYTQKLTEYLLNSFETDRESIEVTVTGHNIILDVETLIPVGLILTELINNSLKHAFPDGKGKIDITLQDYNDARLELIVYDNGTGLKPDYNATKPTLGMQLVADLTAQIDGQMTIDAVDGTRFVIRFPKEGAMS